MFESFLVSVERDVDPDTRETLLHCISMGGTRCPATTTLALAISSNLPPSLRDSLNDWVGASITGFPTASSWKNQFASDPIPGGVIFEMNSKKDMNSFLNLFLKSISGSFISGHLSLKKFSINF